MHDCCEGVNDCLRNSRIPVFALDNVLDLIDTLIVYRKYVYRYNSPRGLQWDFNLCGEAYFSEQPTDAGL